MSDPIFKACTRPATALSVPMVPLVVVCGNIIIVSMLMQYLGAGLWGLLTIPPVYLVMRIITKYDDAQFSLLWLRARCRYKNWNWRFYGASVYNPVDYKKRGGSL